MKVITHGGSEVDYNYCRIGEVFLPLNSGSILEKLFFRTMDVSNVPGKLVRYESPEVYFDKVAKNYNAKNLPQKLKKDTHFWGDSDDEEESASKALLMMKNADIVAKWRENRIKAITKWAEDANISKIDSSLPVKFGSS